MNNKPGIHKSWSAALVEAARAKGIHITESEISRRIAQEGRHDDLLDILMRCAHSMELKFDLMKGAVDDISTMLLPALVELKDGGVAVLKHRSVDSAICWFSEPAAIEREVPISELRAQATGRIALIHPLSTRGIDARLDTYLRPPRKRWLRALLLQDKGSHGEIMLASLFGNILTFGTSLFAMQVWDRVVPAQSIPTLWVLALGVITALSFEFLLRTARVSLSDHIGKKADYAISARFYARAMDIRNDARPRSTGAFIAQLRDIEQLRELLTSTTVATLIDLPFALLFLGLFALLAGPLVFIVLAALVLIIIPGLLIQYPLSNLANAGARESALRNAILVESVERIEEIKALQAEPHFQSQWEQYTLTSAGIGISQRFWTTLYVNWTQTLQQLAYTAVLVAGAYSVMGGHMTMGALIACSILTNRAIVLFMPMGQLFARWQSAKVAMKSLDDLISKPVDHDPEKGLIRRTTLMGDYRFKEVRYSYDPDGAQILNIPHLQIHAGERVALLGRIGAGKSTLLRLLSGMALPGSGKMLLDGTDIGLINPADMRREIGYLNQGAQLFFGTIRDNLLMGDPNASDEDILAALAVTGGVSLVQNQSQGLDMMLQEGGIGLSGGQRQTLLLARTLLRKTNVLLLDEPSAPMDEVTERQFVNRLRDWLGSRTFIVATNRAGLLDLADRVIVIDAGRVVMDGPRDTVLSQLSAPAAKTNQAEEAA
ncbi:MAG: type I secretion system permease/ATPase [Micavibrio sp.]